jgi:flagellar assembly protein FliH
MAGIIKASGLPQPAVKGAAQAFQFDDMGRSYLDRLRAEAAKIVEEARQQAAKIKAQAAEDGKQAAIQAASNTLRARLDQELASVLAALAQSVQTIEQSRHAWQRHWEQHAVKLAAAIAERLCRHELSRQPEITLRWIREALELASGSARVTVRLSPADQQTLGQQIEPIKRQLAGLGAVEVVADPAITPGGCRIDTEFGSLDQQLESQLARITEELLA